MRNLPALLPLANGIWGDSVVAEFDSEGRDDLFHGDADRRTICPAGQRTICLVAPLDDFAAIAAFVQDAGMYEKAAYKQFEVAFRREFQRRLIAARKDLGYEQNDMADALGCSRVAYPKYETRSHFPLILLPALIAITDKPYSYWTVGMPAPPGAKFKRSTGLRIAR